MTVMLLIIYFNTGNAVFVRSRFSARREVVVVVMKYVAPSRYVMGYLVRKLIRYPAINEIMAMLTESQILNLLERV